MELDIKLLMEIIGLFNNLKKTYYLLKSKYDNPYRRMPKSKNINYLRSSWDRFWLG